MTDVVFSGIEGSLDEIETMLKHGYKVDNFMTAFSSFRKSSSFIDKLKELKQTYGFKLFVDSGAHAFVFAQNVKDKKTHGGWHDEAQIVKEFKGHEDDYFQEYLQWLKDNRDVYDYAVELDLQGIVGQEKVEEWRQQLLDSQIPIIFVLHAPAGDNIATIRSWHERGVEYIGMGEIVNDLNKFVMYGREAAKLGMKLHAFGFTPKDLFKYKAFLTTADSSSWLSGSKLAKAVELRGKSLVDINLNDDKIKKASLLNNEFFTIYDIDEVRKKTAGKQYWFFNFWNLFQMQKWTDVNNGKKGYVEQLKVAEETGQPLPAWANAFDKAGRPKTQYLRSRFNGYKSGAFARQVQKFAMYCNNCPVGGASGDAPLCPMYEAGSVCYFLPMWNKLGMKTRNKKEVDITLQNLVADAYARYQFARMTEQMTGVVDKNVTSLYESLVKSLDLYNRVRFGVANTNTINMLNVGDNKVSVRIGSEEALNKVRDLYGEEMTNRIKKRIEKMETVDTDYEERGDENGE